jgi:hypothetical protein
MGKAVPATWTRQLSRAESSAVKSWWENLDSEARRTLATRRANPPLVLFGRFVDADATDDPTQPDDFYEYLVAHEVYLDDGRRFHICRAHEHARAAVSSKRLPATFVCPLDRGTCPMRKLLEEEPGRDLCLSLAGGEGGNR